MSAREQSCIKQFLKNGRKKYPLGCDDNKEEIFNYPYLADDTTIGFIKNHGHVMIIIRGPNSTLKATLSEMIIERYPTAQHCCADHYFSKTFSPPNRNKETLKLSHEYCQKKVETACVKSESPIIVQNTHIRKQELQHYLDLAAVYNYAVIMAVTLYKFEVTPEALESINPDGLNVRYFRMRLRQWEDILPLFTGWFFCSDDVNYILQLCQTILTTLLKDAKFCRVFNSYDDDSIWSYFKGRRNLYCIAGYAYNRYFMKKYYLSDLVQENYGKSFFINFYGYLITMSEVMGIIAIEDKMSQLLFKDKGEKEDTFLEQFSSLDLIGNMAEYKTTVPLNYEDPVLPKTAVFEDWVDETIDFKNCKLIHIAQRDPETFDLKLIKNKCLETLQSLSDDITFTVLENFHVCRLPDDEWLVKLPQKIKFETLFTGLYM